MKNPLTLPYEYPVPTGFIGAIASGSSSFWLWVEKGHSLFALLGAFLGAVSATLAITIMVIKLRRGLLPDK